MSYPCGLLFVLVFLHHVDGLLHVTEDKVAVAIVGLKSHQLVAVQENRMRDWAHVKAALEFAVAAQLHKDNLIEREADEIQGLRDSSTCLLGVGHLGVA